MVILISLIGSLIAQSWPTVGVLPTLTLNVDLSRGVVCSQGVGGHAGVAARVVLEGLGDHQRVQVTVTPDLDVRTVVQLPPLTEPPGQSQRDTNHQSQGMNQSVIST